MPVPSLANELWREGGEDLTSAKLGHVVRPGAMNVRTLHFGYCFWLL